MYIIEEELDKDIWRVCYTSSDYDFITDLFCCYKSKYKDKKFRVTEVVFYVWNSWRIIIRIYRYVKMVYTYFDLLYFYW